MLSRLRAFLSQLSLLTITLGISVALHAALLTVRFVDPESFNKVFKDTPLEVILVNAGTEQTPDKPQALAQLSLAGGGEADAGRATSPLPPSAQQSVGEALEDTQRMLQDMQREQQHLLSFLKDELAALPPPQPRQPTASEQFRNEEERRRHLTEMLAEIEKRIREENARPKKRYLSPATLRSTDAMYYSHFRTLVERAGTQHFPSNNGQKLYGDLVMETWLDRNGRVVDAIVTQSSGNKLLDRRAQAIVRNAGPFGAVPPDVSQGRDLLLVSSRFKFTRDDALEASTQVMRPRQADQP